VRVARELADRVLAPHAAQVDRAGIPPSHIAAIKASGLLGMGAPVEVGGTAAPAPVIRLVSEILAAADATTWFVQVQHHSPLATAVRGEGAARERLLRPLADGTLLAGVAFSQLRSYPHVQVAATPVDGGWQFDGTAPWCTGWGLGDVLMLAGTTPDAEVVFCFIDAREQPGLRASAPMRLAALEASRTVRLHLDGLRVGVDAVIHRTTMADWSAADRRTTVNVNPAVFGIAGAALDLLELAATEDATRLAGVLRSRLQTARRDAYALLDEVPAEERLADRLAARLEAMDMMQTATSAAVIAGGGRAMAATAPAQRLAREAMFLLVQAQTADLRAAQLRHLADQS
jgi:hypothetical protein